MEVKDCRQLTFVLNGGAYGFPIHSVHEVIGLIPITHIPKAPVYIKGIINLRGKVMPVLDLRLKFGMNESDYGEHTSIIVISVNIHGEMRTIGIVVDSIAEVVDIDPIEIEPPPEYGAKEDAGLLKGIGKYKGKIIMLLDIEAVVSGAELAHFIKQHAQNNLTVT